MADMIASMTLKELGQRLPALLNSGLAIELISAPGRGKSTLIEDTVAHMSRTTGTQWGLATAFLATYTPPDLLGYQFKGEREWDGKKVTVTDPTLPLWMITREGKPVWAYERGILLLDEFGQAEVDVKRSAAELLLNGRVGPWALPGGWSVIAASNRISDRSGVTKSLDFVINRRLEVHIQDDLESWQEWALGKGISPLILAFAHQNPHIVFSDGVPEKQGPWCTPRTLVMVDKLIKALAGPDGGIPTDSGTVTLVSGLIGAGAAAQLFAFVRLQQEMPRFEHIVAKPKDVPVPEKPDAQMLVCYNLAHRVDKDTAGPVIQYVERMPKEFAVTFAKAACKRNHELVKTPAFNKWSMENASLMAAVAK